MNIHIYMGVDEYSVEARWHVGKHLRTPSADLPRPAFSSNCYIQQLASKQASKLATKQASMHGAHVATCGSLKPSFWISLHVTTCWFSAAFCSRSLVLFKLLITLEVSNFFFRNKPRCHTLKVDLA